MESATDLMGYSYGAYTYSPEGLRALLVIEGVSPSALVDLPAYLSDQINAHASRYGDPHDPLTYDPAHFPQPLYRGGLQALQEIGLTTHLQGPEEVSQGSRDAYLLRTLPVIPDALGVSY